MKKKLVRKAINTMERFDLEFDLIADSEQSAKMRALGDLDTWARQTGRTIDKMPRVEQIEVTKGNESSFEDADIWNVKFSVDTSIYEPVLD